MHAPPYGITTAIVVVRIIVGIVWIAETVAKGIESPPAAESVKSMVKSATTKAAAVEAASVEATTVKAAAVKATTAVATATSQGDIRCSMATDAAANKVMIVLRNITTP
jgi:hypothetical protein